MSKQQFPPSWDNQRIQRLLAELESLTEDEWVAADEEAASTNADQSLVAVPTALLPEVRRLLADYKATSRES